jgi:hypothetical protein
VSDLDKVVALAFSSAVHSTARHIEGAVSTANVHDHLAGGHGSPAPGHSSGAAMALHHSLHAAGSATHDHVAGGGASDLAARRHFMAEASTPATSSEHLLEIQRIARERGTDAYGRSAAQREASAQRLRGRGQ